MDISKQTNTTTTSNKPLLQQPTVATTSTAVGDQCLRLPTDAPVKTEFKQQAPIVHTTQQAPVLKQVIEKTQQNVIHQDVITEVKQKPTVEIREQPILNQVRETPVITQTNLGVKEENLMQPQSVANPYAGMQTQHSVQQQQGTFTTAPTVTRTVVEQPIHEVVHQPVITEEREKPMINVETQHIVRKTTEAPQVTITREAPMVTRQVQQPQLCNPLPPATTTFAQPLATATTSNFSSTTMTRAPTVMKEIVEEVHQVTHPKGTAPPVPANAEILSTTYSGPNTAAAEKKTGFLNK